MFSRGFGQLAVLSALAGLRITMPCTASKSCSLSLPNAERMPKEADSMIATKWLLEENCMLPGGRRE